MHDDVPLPDDLTASELLLSFCEAYQADRDRMLHEAATEMNECNYNLQLNDGETDDI